MTVKQQARERAPKWAWVLWYRWLHFCGLRWTVIHVDGGQVHIFPIGDSIMHTFDEDCVCGVKTRMLINDDGEQLWMLSHARLDGDE